MGSSPGVPLLVATTMALLFSSARAQVSTKSVIPTSLNLNATASTLAAFDNTSSTINATVSSDNSTSSEINATASSEDSRSSEINATALSEDSLSSEINATALSEDSRSSEINATASSEDSRSSEINATALSEDSLSSEINATALSEDSRSSEINATASSEDSRSSEINATALSEDSLSSEINATASSEDSRSSEINATASSEDSRSLEINATASSEDSRSSEINATALSEDSRSSEINATASSEDSRSSEIHATASSEDSLSSEINATASSEDSRSSEINATALSEDSRSSEINATPSSEDSRSSEINATTSSDNSTSSEINATAASAVSVNSSESIVTASSSPEVNATGVPLASSSASSTDTSTSPSTQATAALPSTSETPESPTGSSEIVPTSTQQVATTSTPATPIDNGELYPYGPALGDGVVNNVWPQISSPIYFTNKLPFGSSGHSVAHVMYGGAVTFGRKKEAYYPDLDYAYDGQTFVVAPFWSWLDDYDTVGKAYHQVYELGVSQGDAAAESRKSDILTRATNDVKTHFPRETSFTASLVLVATWDRVKPYKWFDWVCKYFETDLRDYSWANQTFHDHCVNSQREENTFQAVVISNGQVSYVAFMYKQGAMTWNPYQDYRIAIGYTNGDNIQKLGQVKYIYSDLDQVAGNKGVRGLYMYKIGERESVDQKCLDFVYAHLHLHNDATYQNNINALLECPCSLDRLGRSWWWYSYTSGETADTICYAISTVAKRRMNGNPLNKMCCYEFIRPSSFRWSDWLRAWRQATYLSDFARAGRVLAHDPWWWRSSARDSVIDDIRPHRWCCLDAEKIAKTCRDFLALRRNPGCSHTAPFVNARALGDPHIQTLDGKSYTFNGLGEYILTRITNEDFVLQGRTGTVKLTNNADSKATVFVAFAAQEPDTHYQVELNGTKDGMILKANRVDVTAAFYKNDTFERVYQETVSITKTVSGGRVIAEASFPTGITLKTFVGNQNLEFSVVMPTAFAGLTKGLLGNFNGNLNDEYITASGLTLSSDLDERDIFEQFGKTFHVISLDTVFEYDPGESSADYRHKDFEPIFREEVNETVMNAAQDICGENNDACIFDYVITADKSFATGTLNVSQSNAEEDSSLANTPPAIALNAGQLDAGGFWRVEDGEAKVLNFSSSDADGDNITYHLLHYDQGNSLTIDDNGVLTYTPNWTSPVLIGVRVEDTKGAVSPFLTIPVIVCNNCSGNGVCHDSNTRDEEYKNGNFLLFTCVCEFAWTGDNCAVDVDGCEGSPCLQGQNCSDITANSQVGDVGYECGDCPSGYAEHSLTNSCTDVNECNDTSTCDNADCVNNVGAYECHCFKGYRKSLSDDDACEDINECLERLHDCTQVCTNNDGGYNCSCYDGYFVNTTGDCEQDPTLTSICDDLDCSDLCVNNSGEIECDCVQGHDFQSGSNTTCIDVNECEGASPCAHDCDNEDPGFICSCRDGYRLASDGRECIECTPPSWGPKCTQRCSCSGQGECDVQRGCVCFEGWAGTNCSEDLDECADDPNKCDAFQTCNNTLGDYECNCIRGFEKVTNDCVDINECSNVLTHDCDVALEECVNNDGSYSCVCVEGYSKNAAGVCQDINECDEGIAKCEHICENVAGSYNCRCQYGYRLLSDRESCEQVQDICGEYNLTCDHDCALNRDVERAYCLCNRGYSLVGESTCIDIDECSQDRLNLCETKHLCNNVNGTFECGCEAGFYLDNNGRSCTACAGGTWGEECQNSCSCTDNAASCDPRSGCICEDGFRGTYCEEDIDECETGEQTCPATKVCQNIPGSARCVCSDGYQPVDNHCEDINECASAANNNCTQECVNIPGGFECRCVSGFSGDGFTCTDVDECALQTDNCAQECLNVNGRFRCECQAGFELKSDGFSCEVSAECPESNMCNDTDLCVFADNIETCFCPPGKSLDADNVTCFDVDLCADDRLCEHSCRETKDNSSSECFCNDGYQLDSNKLNCSECANGKYGKECIKDCDCVPLNTAICAKVDGACSCKQGWNGSTCENNIDECDDGSHNCSQNSQCRDTPGDYVCVCQDGFFKSGAGCMACPAGKYGKNCAGVCRCVNGVCNSTDGSCDCVNGWTGALCDVNVNECTDKSDNCTLANRTYWECFDTQGSFRCDCQVGFEDRNNNCTDINECAADHLNQCNQECTNNNGGYTCSCNDGYSLSGSYTCVDDNECATTNPCQQVCVNSEGGFACSCNSGFSLSGDNTTCYASFKYKMQLTFDLELPALTFDPTTTEYQNLKTSLESQIGGVLKETVENFVKYIITKISSGSVVVDGTTIVEDSGNHRGSMVDALLLLANAPITINNQNVTATVEVNGTAIVANASKCDIIAQVSPCPAGSTCVVNNNLAECLSTATTQAYEDDDDDDDDDIALIVGLSVGIPVFILLVVLIIVVVYLKTKNKKLVRVASREGHYNENMSRPASGHSNGQLLMNEEK